ncbi:Reversal of tor2 lethality [Savitreella phatthalungensis]
MALLTLLSALAAGAMAEQTLLGTWQSKSGTVLTGSGFYDPASETFKEPRLPGVSYSFTNDGFFESAMYVITPNPATPQCPTASLMWQHGQYTISASDGALTMVPIVEDSRQLMSNPCASTSAIRRYSYNDTMSSYSVSMDAYHQVYKLILNRQFGAPVQPLYLVSSTPAMLPTSTLHPKSSAKAKKKREILLQSGQNHLATASKGGTMLLWAAAAGIIVGATSLFRGLRW